MSFWERFKAFLSREAEDVKEGFDDLRDKLDAELTRREQELEATPSERLEMIQEDIESSDSVFDRIEDKIDARLGEGDGVAEVIEVVDEMDEDAAEGDGE